MASFVAVEFKIIIYIIGGVAYFIYKRYQSLQKEALQRKANFENKAPEEIFLKESKSFDTWTPNRVKKDNLTTKEISLDNFKKSRKINNDLTDITPDSYMTIDKWIESSDDLNFNKSENKAKKEEVDYQEARKLILYSELLKFRVL